MLRPGFQPWRLRWLTPQPADLLARHHNRLTQLVFETTHRDIGEAG